MTAVFVDNGHSTYVDSEVLKIAQTFNEQVSTGMFVPGFMATYCHTKPLSAVYVDFVLKRLLALDSVENHLEDHDSFCSSSEPEKNGLIVIKNGDLLPH